MDAVRVQKPTKPRPNENCTPHTAGYLAQLAGDIKAYTTYLDQPVDRVTLKLALDVLRYLRVASDSPADIMTFLSDV